MSVWNFNIKTQYDTVPSKFLLAFKICLKKLFLVW